MPLVVPDEVDDCNEIPISHAFKSAINSTSPVGEMRVDVILPGDSKRVHFTLSRMCNISCCNLGQQLFLFY